MILTIYEVKKSLAYWQKIMKLSDWEIEVKVVAECTMLREVQENEPEGGWDPDDDSSALAFLTLVKPEEQVAKILFHRDIKLDPEYGSVFDLESLVIHELIHIIVCEEFKKLPKHIRLHKKIDSLEEFFCNKMSKIIRDFGETE